ncbi:MAG: hypothetical protein Q8N08_05135 [Methanobacteriaceae archaeon]|nr:hypothetical protein [Methanobacteriaceae archaeon]
MVKKIKKSVELEMVQIEIEITKDFFENMVGAKEKFTKETGYEMDYGEYIERVLADLIWMLQYQNKKLIDAGISPTEHPDSMYG